MNARGPTSRALRLLYATIAWNVLTVIISLPAAVVAGSVALAGFGLDSAVEVAASIVAVAALRGSADHQARYLRLIRLAFVAIAVYLVVQAVYVLARRDEPDPSPVGIVLLILTVIVMTTLAVLKRRAALQAGNAVAVAEARVTLIDSGDAALVLVALVANAALGWWWADPLGGLIIAGYSLWEAWEHRG
ncbi:MAG: cation transporter [Chloroflexi bacterium]|nr:cation transporter [Chloroflexota bacterium]